MLYFLLKSKYFDRAESPDRDLTKEEKMKKAYIALVLALAVVAGAAAQTINVLFWDDAYPRTLMERIPEFEKATGIKVNFEILQPPQVFTKTSVSVTKDRTDYDLVCVDEGNIPLFASLMLPYGNLYVWMTRKDIVENPKHKAGFKAQYGYELGVPQTFQQMIDMGTYLQKNGVVSGGFGPFNGGPAGVFGEAIFMYESYGTKFIEWKGGKPVVVLDKAKAIQGMETYKTLMGISPKGAETMAHVERQAAFCADPKGVFTQFIWPAQIASYEDPNKSLVAGNILYSAPPAGPAGRFAVRGTWAVNIPTSSKNKDAAAEFVYWWASKEIASWLVEKNTVPARIDALTDPKFAKSKPWLAAIADSMKYAAERPRFKEVAQVHDIVKKYWIMGITGQMPTDQATQKIIDETNDVLKKAGY
ncbi:MAG: multiple sugar transport system substrate-binding protein [Spirochaetes bacterium]|nr:MAG: multiple sugar transport system substrate-binding protein [Spirochaetota bacterium]